MSKGRLEAFSDGVIAIIITIMVLELKTPEGADLSALVPLMPKLFSYALSFIFLGIYWNNHHHLLHAAGHVNGKILWANLHLLFWLSLVPFVTGWTGETHFAPVPAALYGAVMIMAAIAYTILQNCIIGIQGSSSRLAGAIGRDLKGKISLSFYAIAIPMAFVDSRISATLYVAVAMIWLLPDRRIERME